MSDLVWVLSFWAVVSLFGWVKCLLDMRAAEAEATWAWHHLKVLMDATSLRQGPTSAKSVAERREALASARTAYLMRRRKED